MDRESPAPLSALPPRPAYVVIHPFASAPEKAWPAECFRTLAALQKELQKRVKPPGPPDQSGVVQAYQITEWVTGTFTIGSAGP